MADQELQPQVDRGHPMPRRTTPEASVTLQHHRLARDASLRKASNARTAVKKGVPGSARRNSSDESHGTAQSDPKKWFDRSNKNPTATYDDADANPMDVDPPFFQKESDSSLDEPNKHGYSYAPGLRRPSIRPAVTTHSSSADDYRNIIDDLTVENKRLREELKRYKQFAPDTLKRDKLFEIKVHSLPRRKKLELDAKLRDFAASLEGSSESTPRRRRAGKHHKTPFYPGESLSKHASSSSSRSRPVDSAYASMSTGASSLGPNSSGLSLVRPSLECRSKSNENNFESLVQGTPQGLYPQHLVLPEKERKKLVVRRLEQLFTGKMSGRNLQRNQSIPPMELPPVVDDTQSAPAPPPGPELSRQAQIQEDSTEGKGKGKEQVKVHPREELSGSNSLEDQAESGGNGDGGDGGGSGSGGGSAENKSTSPPDVPPEQRATRPDEVDPDRVQIPAENMDYMRHLGFVNNANNSKHFHAGDVSPDAEGWVYLNLLCNMAQLHMLNVTPGFIRSAVSEKSTKFQLSPDGRKLRWRGGTDGTKFSSDSSGDTSQKSPSTDDTDADGGNNEGQRKRQKGSGGEAVSFARSAKEPSTFGPQKSTTSNSLHYRPMFVHHNSSLETSPEESDSQGSSILEDSHMDTGGKSRWGLSESGPLRRKKRRAGGAIVYYVGAPFCLDLSRDPDCRTSTACVATSGAAESERQSRPQQPARSESWSSLPIRAPGDKPCAAGEASLRQADQADTPDLMEDDGEGSMAEDDVAFPWCRDPDTVRSQPAEPILEPCGLAGIQPEDHFAVVVTTRRPILPEPTQIDSHNSTQPTSSAGDAAKFSSSTTTRQRAPHLRPRTPKPVDADKPVGIEYLSSKLRKLKPIPLPPPASIFPPFSSDLDDETEEDGTGVDFERAYDSDISRSEEVMVSHGAQHRSQPGGDDMFDEDEEMVALNDEGDEDDDVVGDVGIGGMARSGNAGAMGRNLPGPLAEMSFTPSRRMTGMIASGGGPGKRRIHPPSSVATAGDGAESGYNTEVEDAFD